MLSILSEAVDLIADSGEGQTGSAAFVVGIFPILFLLLILAGILAIFFGILYSFYKKRLEHKQMMAAIEKGTPLSELKPAKPAGPLWIRNLTAGIGLLILGAALAWIGNDALEFWIHEQGWRKAFGYVQIAPFALGVIFFAIGVSRVIRGILQRRAERPRPPAEKRPNWIKNLAVGIALLVPVPAFLLFGRNGFWSWVFYGHRSLSSAQKFGVALFVLGLILPAFGVLYLVRGYLQRRAARSTEAVARRTSGITNLAVGIALLLPVLPLLMIGANAFWAWISLRFQKLSPTEQSMIVFFILGVILLPFGVFFIVRGYLQRKAERPREPVEKRPNWIRNLAVGIALLVPVPAFLLLGRNSIWDWAFYGRESLSSAHKFGTGLFVLGLILPAFGVLYLVRGFLQRKAERKAVAVEKGIPLSELESSAWITNVSIGVGLFVLSLPLLLNFLQILHYNKRVEYTRLVPLTLFFAVALGFLIRGLLLRKAQRRIRPSGQVSGKEDKRMVGVSKSETLKQTSE